MSCSWLRAARPQSVLGRRRCRIDTRFRSQLSTAADVKRVYDLRSRHRQTQSTPAQSVRYIRLVWAARCRSDGDVRGAVCLRDSRLVYSIRGRPGRPLLCPPCSKDLASIRRARDQTLAVAGWTDQDCFRAGQAHNQRVLVSMGYRTACRGRSMCEHTSACDKTSEVSPA